VYGAPESGSQEGMMYNGEKVIDIHGHHSTPAQFRAYAYNLIALRTATGNLALPEGGMIEAQTRHLGMMDERNIDVQFISPRPVAMMHWEQPLIQAHWCRTTNDVIHQTVEMNPDRFRGVAQLPQVGVDFASDTSDCVPEFERAVKELGFVGATLNPDPGGDRRAPGVNDPYWYPLYEASCSLRAPLVVHASISRDPRIAILPHNYQYNFMTEEALATALLEESDVFDRYPDLKVIVCHCGGALSRFVPRAESSGIAGGGQVGIGGQQPAAHVAVARDTSKNLFFDTCAYDPDYLATAFKHKGVSQIMFGTESPGSGTGVLNPATGKPSDDLVPVIDGFDFLSAADKKSVFREKAFEVFPLFKE
jgi:predicted TIM-barrel fold metal-dependent hydrolase